MQCRDDIAPSLYTRRRNLPRRRVAGAFLMSDSPSVIDNAPSIEPTADETTATPQADAADEPTTTDAAPDTGTESTADDAGDDDHEPDT